MKKMRWVRAYECGPYNIYVCIKKLFNLKKTILGMLNRWEKQIYKIKKTFEYINKLYTCCGYSTIVLRRTIVLNYSS